MTSYIQLLSTQASSATRIAFNLLTPQGRRHSPSPHTHQPHPPIPHEHSLPLVLLQGWTGTKEDWAGLPSALLSQGPPPGAILTYDHLGIGESPLPTLPLTLASLTNDALALTQALGFPRFHVMGISMGGMMAQLLALSAPPGRVASLTLGSTTHGGPTALPPNYEFTKTFEAWKDATEEGGQERGMEERRREIMERWLSLNLPRGFGSSDPQSFLRLREAFLKPTRLSAGIREQLKVLGRFNVAKELQGISIPTLILHGDQDQVMPVGNAPLIQEKIPRARAHILKGAGHMFWLSHLEETVKVVGGFLAEAEGQKR